VMIMDGCTEDRFLRDTKDHTMSVIFDDGVNRHISFTNNGSSCYRFDLTTWEGHLCISGDMGTYVFRRLTDMFMFFRTDKNDFNYNKEGISINAGYWAEKLQSEKSYYKGMEFSEDMVMKSITDHAKGIAEDYSDEYEDYTDQSGDKFDSGEDFINAFTSEVDDHFQYRDMDEVRYVSAVDDFSSEIIPNLNFTDCWEWLDAHNYTFHYIWCLYAIAWGVAEYDKSKES